MLKRGKRNEFRKLAAVAVVGGWHRVGPAYPYRIRLEKRRGGEFCDKFQPGRLSA